MNLYEINEAIEKLVDPETGEIQNIEEFEALGMAFNEKIENVACWIKNLVSDAEAIKAEEKTLHERRQALESKADKLKNYLSFWLDGKKFETSKVKCSFRKSSSVVVSDANALIKWARENGKDYLLTEKEPEPNKTMIKDYIKNGGKVEGASVVENSSLNIK